MAGGENTANADKTRRQKVTVKHKTERLFVQRVAVMRKREQQHIQDIYCR